MEKSVDRLKVVENIEKNMQEIDKKYDKEFNIITYK